MQKQTPGFGQIAVMVGFTLSVFGLLTFLWLSFGGAVPLRPEGYRVKVPFPEAALLVEEADVRISGITIGKVKGEELSLDPPATIATLDIEEEYAPIPRNTRAILRQKTLLGETYVELTPGDEELRAMEDGGTLPFGQVERSTEIDEIYSAFDEETRAAVERWLTGQARAIKGAREPATAGDRGLALNQALGSLPGFVTEATDVLAVLDGSEQALQELVRNTGVVFDSLTEQGALRDLVVNSQRLFDATAARDEALARAIGIFPTFLRESRATLRRLDRFALDTQPLVDELRPVAPLIAPTLLSLRKLSPDLEDLFSDLRTLIDIAPETLPDAERVLAGAEPVVDALHAFLPELNPILSFANFQSPVLADFLTVGGAALGATLPPRAGAPDLPRHVLRQIALINEKSFTLNRERPPGERANAYLEPNALLRAHPLGNIESFSCAPAGGEIRNPDQGVPPCFEKPSSLFDRQLYPTLQRGGAPLVPPPDGTEGVVPADPDALLGPRPLPGG